MRYPVAKYKSCCYECRWIIEDSHQVLKTGGRVEDSQLDDIPDIQALTGFLAPLAVRLLQLRHIARAAPDRPATGVVDPLWLKLLCKRFNLPDTITILEFWLRTAQLGAIWLISGSTRRAGAVCGPASLS